MGDADHHVRRERILIAKGIVKDAPKGGRPPKNSGNLPTYSEQAAEDLGVHRDTVRRDLARTSPTRLSAGTGRPGLDDGGPHKLGNRHRAGQNARMHLRLIMLCVALTACSAPAPTGHQESAVAPPAASPPPVTLMTTWLVPDQPPQVAQTSFRSADECAAAKVAVLAEGKSLRERLGQQNASDKAAVLRELQDAGCGFGCSPSPADLKRMAGQPLPSVTAMCLEGGTAPAAGS